MEKSLFSDKKFATLSKWTSGNKKQFIARLKNFLKSVKCKKLVHKNI